MKMKTTMLLFAALALVPAVSLGKDGSNEKFDTGPPEIHGKGFDQIILDEVGPAVALSFRVEAPETFHLFEPLESLPVFSAVKLEPVTFATIIVGDRIHTTRDKEAVKEPEKRPDPGHALGIIPGEAINVREFFDLIHKQPDKADQIPDRFKPSIPGIKRE